MCPDLHTNKTAVHQVCELKKLYFSLFVVCTYTYI